jgi:hypothetical protein
MSFITPLFFFGMLAAAVPIFLHLIKRERATKVEFPTLMFLRKISKKVIRFQKLRHLLLLLLRVLAFLLLALAFTRPFRETVSAARPTGKVSIAHIILLDNSMSMAYGDRWEKARKAASDIARSAEPGDRLALLMFSDTATALTQLTEDPALVLGQITNGAELTDHATRYGQALKLAEKFALEASAGKRVVHLISDYQKNGWFAEDQDFKFHSSIELKPVDVGSEEYSNLTLGDVEVLEGDESSGGGLRIKSSIVNLGSQERNNVAVSLLMDGRVVLEKRVDVTKSGLQGVEFQVPALSPGQHSVVLQVEDPQLTRDNRFNLTLEARAKTPVLSIENPTSGRGSRSPSFFLGHALNIGTLSPYRLTALTPQKAEALPSFSGGLLVWNNAGGGGAALQKRIQDFVRGGGGLVIVLADSGLAPDFNRTFGSWIPVKMDDSVVRARSGAGSRSGQDYALLTDIKLDHPIFRPFSEPHSGSFASAKIFKHTRLVVGAGAEVLARFDDGEVALAAATLDKGRILIFASSADDSANDLPLKAVFAPFWQQMLRYVDNLQEERRWVEVGESFAPRTVLLETMLRQGKATIDLNQAVVVIDSAKQRVPLAARSGDVAVDKTGFYEIRTASLSAIVASNSVPRESDLTHVNAEELVAGWSSPDAGGPAVVADDERLSAEEQERQQRIWRYLLLAVLVFLISECLLANQSVLKPD